MTPATEQLLDALGRWTGHTAGLDPADRSATGSVATGSASAGSATGELEPADSAAARLLLETAERFLAGDPDPHSLEPMLWHDYLEETGRPRFLTALGEDELRRRWAETAFAAIRLSGYRLEDLMARRIEAFGDKSLFSELGGSARGSWSYAQVQRRARGFAAAFLAETGGRRPRVALFVDNGVAGACCDLACLLHDILVVPLSVHTDSEELLWMFDRLGIDLAVADTEDRVRRLVELGVRTLKPFTVFALAPSPAVARGDARLLDETVVNLAPSKIEGLLRERSRFSLDETSTVMFTSGSTGRPRGVAFTPMNVLSKRFARAAALPTVGHDERLLCYLPLYHTFGRYLEMLGTIYWGGSYVFAGNPSAETLLSGMARVEPTGLISIPLRWSQIREKVEAEVEGAPGTGGSDALREAYSRATGGRLRWGLSAAGYLDPKTFRFFHRQGTALCSGFGMTEATGGITMSPPADYVDNTVGVALPGMKLHFRDNGEMLIGGVYTARYLAAEGDDLENEPTESIDGEEMLATGDLFETLERQHVAIVDRVKDIYKNNRGQTIAPRRVEREFNGVPGIKRVFLVGDRRSTNALLIVPDPEDPVLERAPDDESRREYFEQIIAKANQRLAPFERVVSYALLDRDFEDGELTPKGSYRRRVIEESFASTIEELYAEPHVEIEFEDLRLRLPRWFHRDLGVLDDDIALEGNALRDRRRRASLWLEREPSRDTGDLRAVRVGDLVYRIDGELLDLGKLCRQPALWLGNGSLLAFAPCKKGWDVDPAPFDLDASLPDELPELHVGDPSHVDDPHLRSINRLVEESLFGSEEIALASLEKLGEELSESGERLDATVRRRIRALAIHPSFSRRCLAYRVLLLDEPSTRYNEAFGSFIRSGLPFLDEQSLHAIAAVHFEGRRLPALRQRLHSYRRRLSWPASEVVRQQLETLLRLLVDVAGRHPEFYDPVRVELASWILHRDDPQLSTIAERLHRQLADGYENSLEGQILHRGPRLSDDHIVFDDDLGEEVRERLRMLLIHTGFLYESLSLIHDEDRFDPDELGPGGIWISAIQSASHTPMYRLSLTTRSQRHFDLVVILRDDVEAQRVRDTIYWMQVIGGHPKGGRVLPRFGCARPELGAISLQYVDELNAAERIRQLACSQSSSKPELDPRQWQKLFVRSMATFFTAWHNSGERVVPGILRPANVVTPELDFHESARVLSLAGWKPYESPVQLFLPLIRNFYRRTRALYPACGQLLSLDWLTEACVQGLGEERAGVLLAQLRDEFVGEVAEEAGEDFARVLDTWLENDVRRYHPPLPLQNAIDRYQRWLAANPEVSAEARTAHLDDLLELYRLARFGERARYYLYRHTYFEEASLGTLEIFDRLLAQLGTERGASALNRLELSELQDSLHSVDDRACFARMVFPAARKADSVEVMTFGESEEPGVTLRTNIQDRLGQAYSVREPMEAEEVGRLYRLFYREHFPKIASRNDRHLIATDAEDRIVAGLCYRHQAPDGAHLDGVVVESSVAGRGIATAVLDDLIARLTSQGVRVLKTGFIMRRFCERRGFTVDRRYGGLVRFLDPESERQDPIADD